MSFQRDRTTLAGRPLRGKALWPGVFAGLIAVALAPVVCRGLLRSAGSHSASAPAGITSGAAASGANSQKAVREISPEAFAEKQKQIAADSTELLKMANELKAEVDKTNKDTLSLTVIRKADAVEKLAHVVKEKMKASRGMD